MIDRPGASLLAQRAFLLMRLGEHALARETARSALRMDPGDPVALLAAAESLSARHAIAILQSRFSSDRQRKDAVALLDAGAAPGSVCRLLRTGLRVTTISTGGMDVSLSHREEGDHFCVLGRTQVGGADPMRAVYVMDHYLQRPSGGEARKVTIRCGAYHQTALIPSMTHPQPARARAVRPVAHPWVIVPVFNSAETLTQCLKSLRRELDGCAGARALVVDDASDDPALPALLAQLVAHPRIELLRQDANLGFVGTVNHALAEAGPGPVLLLNTDTYMPPGTLNRLLRHLSQPDVATITPLSNNGGSFTLPFPGDAYVCPAKTDADALGRLAARLHAGRAVDVLTGNGFCMLISEAARIEVGRLSEEYDSGYYEEVDFCLRASEQGYRHVAAVDCFVAHVGTVSYADQKKRLVQENRKRLCQRFPFYPAAYDRTMAIDPLRPYRAAIMAESRWKPVRRPDPDQIQHHFDIRAFIRPVIPVSGTLPRSLGAAFDAIRPCPESWAQAFAACLGAPPFAMNFMPGRVSLCDVSGGVVAETAFANPQDAGLRAFQIHVANLVRATYAKV